MFTEMFYKLSQCVCEFWTECSQHSLSLGCANGRTNLHTYTAWVYIPSSAGLLEGSDRWSEGSSFGYNAFEGLAGTSKDHPSRTISRSISFEVIEGSTLSFDHSSFEPDNFQQVYLLLTESNQEDG
ncbi:hypothetical protein HanRHA438_Chr09g0375581 [Helianthus annuus]|nr:hypothetical protein HanRHA438_Chr09g0375581 [Helianthus annuus]